MSRSTAPTRQLYGHIHHPNLGAYSAVPSSDASSTKINIEEESDEDDDPELAGEASEENACQKFMISVGITWFLPVSYHNKERRKFLAQVIRVNRRYKKERKTDLDNCILRAREASGIMEHRKQCLVEAFDRTGGRDDIAISTLRADIFAARAELTSRLKLVEVAQSEFDNVCKILSHLEIEQRLAHGDKAENLFNRFIKKGRNPNRVMNEHLEIRNRMTEFANNTQMRVDSRTTESELSNILTPASMGDMDQIVEECRSISAAKRKPNASKQAAQPVGQPAPVKDIETGQG